MQVNAFDMVDLLLFVVNGVNHIVVSKSCSKLLLAVVLKLVLMCYCVGVDLCFVVNCVFSRAFVFFIRVLHVLVLLFMVC